MAFFSFFMISFSIKSSSFVIIKRFVFCLNQKIQATIQIIIHTKLKIIHFQIIIQDLKKIIHFIINKEFNVRQKVIISRSKDKTKSSIFRFNMFFMFELKFLSIFTIKSKNKINNIKYQVIHKIEEKEFNIFVSYISSIKSIQGMYSQNKIMNKLRSIIFWAQELFIFFNVIKFINCIRFFLNLLFLAFIL